MLYSDANRRDEDRKFWQDRWGKARLQVRQLRCGCLVSTQQEKRATAAIIGGLCLSQRKGGRHIPFEVNAMCAACDSCN